MSANQLPLTATVGHVILVPRQLTVAFGSMDLGVRYSAFGKDTGGGRRIR